VLAESIDNSPFKSILGEMDLEVVELADNPDSIPSVITEPRECEEGRLFSIKDNFPMKYLVGR